MWTSSRGGNPPDVQTQVQVSSKVERRWPLGDVGETGVGVVRGFCGMNVKVVVFIHHNRAHGSQGLDDEKNGWKRKRKCLFFSLTPLDI